MSDHDPKVLDVLEDVIGRGRMQGDPIPEPEMLVDGLAARGFTIIENRTNRVYGAEMINQIQIERPDPRLVTSYCKEGVGHDHTACAPLWNGADPSEIERSIEWVDAHRDAERARLHRAAQHLRGEYLCNWDTRVAAALADWLESEASRHGTTSPQALSTASALLESFGLKE